MGNSMERPPQPPSPEKGNDWYEKLKEGIDSLPKFEGFTLDSIDGRGCPYYIDERGKQYSLSPSEKLKPALNTIGGEKRESPPLDEQPNLHSSLNRTRLHP